MIDIIKADGRREPFDEHKLRRSLRRAHIPQKHHDAVVRQIMSSLYPGIPTREIYQHVQNFFMSAYPEGAPRYNLKQAIMELGPSGYPFERYIGALLERQGYVVQVGTVVRGTCVSHEVDVLAKKGHEHYMIECKFHNEPGLRSDVKVSLYVQARYLDILNAWKKQEPPEEQNDTHQAWLVTNTKCTADALEYAQCVGMKVLGWNYPEHGSLQDMIEESHLHPITSLTTLSQSHKQALLNKNIVMVRDLEQQQSTLNELGLTMLEAQAVRREMATLMQEQGEG
ncbi:MAG TPA: ATPase [Candidatus Pacebacteria bacterium]|nr:MAG: hypothetical protein UX00_C0004G0030 [Microgenomates group bacterium GW2011_GWB1_45_17]KKU23972.1 MAG: hypothetical protein UX35_C0003G0108 [Microgenomates group bacterium GW2011_GWA1_46_15]KKU24635.1 MAG: hypothetical protein UX36_C0001G0252 [Microgenomates group bacterium GW2011_GWC1_46_15]HAV15220.1 ATPase [Candidatus Paceibacterota bacterium]HCR10935.1 ATPase [Candidatus Paceibacterota bacterium]